MAPALYLRTTIPDMVLEFEWPGTRNSALVHPNPTSLAAPVNQTGAVPFLKGLLGRHSRDERDETAPVVGLTAPEPSTLLRPCHGCDRTQDYSIGRKREKIDADQCVSGADQFTQLLSNLDTSLCN